MEVRAKAKYLRISPQKVRSLIGHLKDNKAQEVEEKLRLMPQKSALLILKLVKSAIANAEHNYNLKKDDLRISQIIVEEGPSYKRIKPRARGGRDIIKKRTSHILVILTSKEAPKKVVKKEVKKVPETKVKKKVLKEKLLEKKVEKKKKKLKKAPPKKLPAKKPTKEAKKPYFEEEEKRPIKKRKPFFQRFFRRKGGM